MYAMTPPVPQGEPISRQEAVRSILMAIVLSLVTCGIYGLYWQYMQFKTLNAWIGREEHNFGMYLLFSILTCGVYAIYYEYKFALSMTEVQRARGMVVNENLPMMAVALAFFGFAMVTWAIEQQEINRWYGAGPDGT
jgi:Zn-dependent protease with chaperone function